MPITGSTCLVASATLLLLLAATGNEAAPRSGAAHGQAGYRSAGVDLRQGDDGEEGYSVEDYLQQQRLQELVGLLSQLNARSYDKRGSSFNAPRLLAKLADLKAKNDFLTQRVRMG